MSAASPTLERTFRGHRSGVTGVSFHHSLQQVASSSQDGCVMVWNFKPTLRAFRYVGHRGPVNCVEFSSNGNIIASGSSDCSIRLWIPTVKGESSVLKAHAGSVRSLSFSGDGRMLATGSDDKSIKVWNTTTQRFMMGLPGHQNWVRSVSMSHDGRLVVSGSDDKVVNVWDLSSRKSTHSFYDHTAAVQCVAFHPDNNLVAAGSADNTINIWDLRINKLMQHYEAHDDGVNSLSFHPSGSWLVSTSADASAKIWDVKEGFLFCTLQAHEGAVNNAQFSPCGRRFATSGQDGLVMVWESNLPGSNSKGARPQTPHGDEYARYVDPVNTVLSAPQNVSKSEDSRPVSSASRRPVSRSRATKRPDSAHSNSRAAPLRSTSVPTHDAVSRPAAARHTTTIEAEVSVEEMLRQVDITTQTQKLLETRLSQSEAQLKQMADSFRDREQRMLEQQEIVLQQLGQLNEQNGRQRQDIEFLTQALQQQQQVFKKMLDDQTAHFSQEIGSLAAHFRGAKQ